MKHKISLILILSICFVILFAANVHAQTTITSNEIDTHDGYDYEFWMDEGSGSGTMTLNSGGTFSAEWSNVHNILFRKGRKFDETSTHQELGEIVIDYGVDYNPDGNSYLCVYGWTTDPLVEYYVVESWGDWRPPGSNSLGTITVDGATYDIYETIREEKPSIIGTATFPQYWSVRQSRSESGTVSVSEHFEAWESMGMEMGNMYEVAFTVEGYQSSGQADVYENTLYIDEHPGTEHKPGDVNEDGEIDIFDMILLAEYIVGATDEEVSMEVADVNGDGVLDIQDLILIARYIVGEIDEFPVEN